VGLQLHDVSCWKIPTVCNLLQGTTNICLLITSLQTFDTAKRLIALLCMLFWRVSIIRLIVWASCLHPQSTELLFSRFRIYYHHPRVQSKYLLFMYELKVFQLRLNLCVAVSVPCRRCSFSVPQYSYRMRNIDKRGDACLCVWASVVSCTEKATMYFTGSSQILRKYGKFEAIWKIRNK